MPVSLKSHFCAFYKYAYEYTNEYEQSSEFVSFKVIKFDLRNLE